MLVLGFEDHVSPPQQLGKRLDWRYDSVSIHRFPDQESLVQVPASVPETVCVYRSLYHPNSKLIELIITAETLRKQGAGRVLLVCPYLCYMRQDKAFAPGQAVSQPIIGKLLGDYFDDVITVDPHLHRIASLSEAIPNARAVSLKATKLMSSFLQQRKTPYTLVGPDSESEQWVKAIAHDARLDYVIAEKQRHGDRDVNIALPELDYHGRHMLLVDDVISSGQTMMTTARNLQQAGCASFSALCTHALFADQAYEQMLAQGFADIWSTDSIAHPSNSIALAPLLADCISEQL